MKGGNLQGLSSVFCGVKCRERRERERRERRREREVG